MATTYYARSVTGNWAANGSWSTNTPADATNTGTYPVAGDTAVFEGGGSPFTGTITLAAAAATAVLNCVSGATGTLAFGTYGLTCSGNITLASGMTYSASGTALNRGNIYSNGTVAIDTGGLTALDPMLVLAGSSTTKTLTTTGTTLHSVWITTALTVALASDFNVTTIYVNPSSLTFSGAHDIIAGTFKWSGQTSAVTLTLVDAQTLTVSTLLELMGGNNTTTIKSSVTGPGHDTYLHFNGAAADCRVAGMTFTDVNCAHAIDNWYGGTLTRTTGITNRTSADIGGGTGGGALVGSSALISA